MGDAAEGVGSAYHLVLDREEVPVAMSALRLLISDEAHQIQIRQLARDVVAALQAMPDEHGTLTVPLAAKQMKITHSAAKLLLNDLQREQPSQREVLRRILGTLPDEHTIGA